MPMYVPELFADQVFILRFWRETIGDGNSQWRAQVSHINACERLTLNNVEATLALVASRLEAIIPGPDRNRGPL